MDNQYYNNPNYYYTEIATCIEKIDRLKAKKYKFTIPSLIPTMENEKEQKNEIKNKKVKNIENEEDIIIDSITINNYIEIYVPLEVMSIIPVDLGLEGKVELKESSISGSKISANNLSENSGYYNLSPAMYIAPIEEGYTVISSLQVGSASIISAYINSLTAKIKGTLNIKTEKENKGIKIIPNDRYIEKGSKWIITFISGDPSKPAILARYQ